jgi:RNAse (barnase) inhibitor barstar
MCAVRFFGIEISERLQSHLADFGFYPMPDTTRDGFGFAKRLSEIDDVPSIELDAVEWKSDDDVYDAFFRAVGAPEWHGRNFDALNDSIESSGINELEVPFRIVVRNVERAEDEARDFLKEFAALISAMNSRGCPVEMLLET